MSTKEEIGRRIREARKERKLTQSNVCELVAGLQVSTLSNWEQGLREMGVDEAKRLAPVLGVSAAYLLTLTDEPASEAISDDERHLLELYRHADERGHDAILGAAETLSSYGDAAQAADAAVEQPSESGPEKRAAPRTVRTFGSLRPHGSAATPTRKTGRK